MEKKYQETRATANTTIAKTKEICWGDYAGKLDHREKDNKVWKTIAALDERRERNTPGQTLVPVHGERKAVNDR